MFKSKRKSKKIEISAPTNFCHRVHTDFDERQNKYVGLPLQWVSLVERNAKALETRPRGLIDPLQVTPTDAMDLQGVGKPVVRGGGSPAGGAPPQEPVRNGVAVLPRSSSVARSNSLRQQSPPTRLRTQQRGRQGPAPLPEEAEPPVPEPRPSRPPSGHGGHGPLSPPEQQVSEGTVEGSGD